jgi:succinoglycan biosynthesis protein ExoO
MTVSVVIPAYNVALCVERAIRSAIDQSLQPVEVIVVDDGSADSTCDVVSRLAKDDSRIKLLKQPVNKGPGAARNIGFEAAEGDWIAILDADDAFLRDRLRYLVEVAERRNLTFAADNVTLYDAAAQRVIGPGIEPDRIGSCLDLDRHSFVRNCLWNGGMNFSIVHPIIRRSFLTASGIRYAEEWRSGEDFLFYLRALMAGARFCLFPESWYVYSERFGSISRKPSDLSRTIENHRVMERLTLELTSEPEIRADPLLSSLLVARADMISALCTRRELRHFLRNQNYLQRVLYFVRQADARAIMWSAFRKRLAERWTLP